MLICDCDACGSRGRPPIYVAGDAARHFSFTAAPLARRALLGALAATAVALASPVAAMHVPRRAGAKRDPPIACEGPATLQWPTGLSERRLVLHNAVTGESFDGVFWARGRFDGEALAQLNELMRDTHADTVARCDEQLFDLLACVQAHVRKPFHILSGFRSRETNFALGLGDPLVARDSFHIRGMAVDLFVEGVPPREFAQKAREVGAGGVGAGATSVHLDTGPMRSWAY